MSIKLKKNKKIRTVVAISINSNYSQFHTRIVTIQICKTETNTLEFFHKILKMHIETAILMAFRHSFIIIILVTNKIHTCMLLKL